MTFIPQSSPYSNEMNMLLACTGLNTDNTKNILTLAEQSPPDWPTFFQLAERHAILPLVWHNLKNLDTLTIPADTRQYVQQQFIINTQRALMQVAELARITRLFQDAGIKLLALKGPTLALQAYGNLSLRHAGDLDILLVNPEEIWQAHNLMRQAGYHYTGIDLDTLTPKQKTTYLKLDQHLCYLNNKGLLTIELHHRWAKNPYYFKLTAKDAYQRSQDCDIAGTTVKTLSTPDQFLYLCSHGAGHAWARLQWLCDIPAILAKATENDLEQIKALTYKLGEQRKVIQTLQLCLELIPAQLPSSLTTMQPDKTIKHLISLAKIEIQREQAYWQTDYPLIKNLFLKLSLLTYKPRLKQDMRYTGYSLYLKSINIDAWKHIKSPDQLFFLHLILQPFFWLTRKLRQIPYN